MKRIFFALTTLIMVCSCSVYKVFKSPEPKTANLCGENRTTQDSLHILCDSALLFFHTGTTQSAPVPVKYSSLHFDTSAINRRPCAFVRCASRSSLITSVS